MNKNTYFSPSIPHLTSQYEVRIAKCGWTFIEGNSYYDMVYSSGKGYNLNI